MAKAILKRLLTGEQSGREYAMSASADDREAAGTRRNHNGSVVSAGSTEGMLAREDSSAVDNFNNFRRHHNSV